MEGYDIMNGGGLWADTKEYVSAHWLALVIVIVIILIVAWYFDALPAVEGMGNVVALQKSDEVFFNTTR